MPADLYFWVSDMDTGILKTHTGRLGLATAIVVTALTLGSAASATMFTDPGTFTEPPWSETILGGGDVVDTRMNSGGNPGDWLQVQTVPSGANGANVVWGAYINSLATWDPSTQGAIDSLSMMIDVKAINAFGQGQGIVLALTQDGNIYGTGSAITGIPSDWTTISPHTNAMESAFGLFDETLGTRDSSMNPDFSVLGSVIELGFMVGNSGSNPISGTTMGYDNWKLTVNTSVVDMPEPGTLALLGLGLAGVGFARRRRK